MKINFKTSIQLLIMSGVLILSGCNSKQNSANSESIQLIQSETLTHPLWNGPLPQYDLKKYEKEYFSNYYLSIKPLLRSSNSAKPVINSNERLIDYPRFMDDTGFITTFKKTPKNVAVLFSSYAEVWQAAGGDVAITVKESVTRGIVHEKDVQIVGSGSGKEINFELLLSYQPDLVIMTADYESQIALAQRLRVFDIPVLVFRTDNFFDYLNMLSVYTTILGTRDSFERYGSNVMDQIECVLSYTATRKERPRVLFLRAYSYGAKVKSTEHFVGQMLKDLGAINVADYGNFTMDTLSPEVIAASNVDYILISMMGEDESAIYSYIENELLVQPVFSSLTAVKEKKYYILPKDMFSYKPNHRWGDAYQYLADLLYPQQNLEEN